jgi:hypothetical protein
MSTSTVRAVCGSSARTDLVQRITLLLLWVKVPSAEIVQLLP